MLDDKLWLAEGSLLAALDLTDCKTLTELNLLGVELMDEFMLAGGLWLPEGS